MFQDRLMYSMTGDIRFIHHMLMCMYDYRSSNILYNEKGKHFFESLCTNRAEDEVIIYGAGYYGSLMFGHITRAGGKVLAFCDRDVSKAGSLHCGIPVLSIDELMQGHQDKKVLITVIEHEKEIYNSLSRLGFPEENIITTLGTHYFDESIPLEKKPKEIFVDAGAYDGKSALEFCLWNPDYEKVYAVEPEEENCVKCRDTFSRNKIVSAEVIQSGLWSYDGVLKLCQDQDRSYVTEQGDITVSVSCLDHILEGQRADFIKMDIEGAEMEALKGAADTIRKYHPKLAICVYHKPEDIIEIPSYIKMLNPDYKFYLRHYTLGTTETVLFAI